MLMPRALGWTAVPGCRSTSSDGTPSCESRMDALRPTGPPPTMRTGVSTMADDVGVYADQCHGGPEMTPKPPTFGALRGGSDVHDLVIDNARVIDGLGGPARSGGVAVTDGRIAAVGGDLGPARERLHAAGLVL